MGQDTVARFGSRLQAGDSTSSAALLMKKDASPLPLTWSPFTQPATNPTAKQGTESSLEKV